MTRWAAAVSPAGTALSASLLLAVALSVAFVLLPGRGRTLVMQLVVTLLLPGIGVALHPGLLVALLPRVVRLSTGSRPPLHLVLGPLPLLLLPLISVLARLPSGQARAAAGLGASRAMALRLVWLPQLGPPLLLGLILAGSVDLVASLAAR